VPKLSQVTKKPIAVDKMVPVTPSGQSFPPEVQNIPGRSSSSMAPPPPVFSGDSDQQRLFFHQGVSQYRIPTLPLKSSQQISAVARTTATQVVVQAVGTSPVTSVAGKTGAVILDESDITNLVTDLSNLNTDIAINATAIATETARAEAAEALLAPLASPVLTGAPKAPTQPPLDNSTNIATTAYTDLAVAVEKTRALGAEALLAPLASPALTGVPVAPTATPLTNSTQVATTAYTDAAVAAAALAGAYNASGVNGSTAATPILAGAANPAIFYEIQWSINVTTPDVSGTLVVTIAWNDGISESVSSASIPATAAGSTRSIVAPIQCTDSISPTIAVVAAGTTAALAYQLNARALPRG
jgi:hypothetical protein